MESYPIIEIDGLLRVHCLAISLFAWLKLGDFASPSSASATNECSIPQPQTKRLIQSPSLRESAHYHKINA